MFFINHPVAGINLPNNSQIKDKFYQILSFTLKDRHWPCGLFFFLGSNIPSSLDAAIRRNFPAFAERFVLKMGGCQSSTSTSDSVEKKLVSFSSEITDGWVFSERASLEVYLIQWSFGKDYSFSIYNQQCQWTMILIVFDLQVVSMIYRQTRSTGWHFWNV